MSTNYTHLLIPNSSYKGTPENSNNYINRYNFSVILLLGTWYTSFNFLTKKSIFPKSIMSRHLTSYLIALFVSCAWERGIIVRKYEISD